MDNDVVGIGLSGRLIYVVVGLITTQAFNLYAMLFMNQYTITYGTTMANLTPLIVAGYAARALPAASWGARNDDSTSGACTISYGSLLSWTFTAGGPTIYGHAIYDSISGNFCWGANWPTPYTIPSIGGQVQLNISLTIGPCGSGSLAARSSRRVRAARLQRST